MKNVITDLLQSAKILAKADQDQMLCYLIDMALQMDRETNPRAAPKRKAA